jgi:hypothetical protein
MSIFKTLANKLFAVTDGIYDRASMGNLDEHTGPNGVVSPAQYGFRAIDDQGNAIFDSLGLIAVMKLLGSPVINLVGDTRTGTGLFQTAANSTVPFQLTRKTTVLCLGAVNFLGTAASGPSGTILVDGTQNDQNGPTVYGPGTPPGVLGFTLFSVVNLAAGAHTFSLGIAIAAGQVWVADTYYLYAFSLGA